jgi:HlyD family secretion protein
VKTFLISSGVVLAILAVVGGGGLWIVGRGKSRVNVATPVRLECPVCGDLVEVVNAPGEIQPQKKVLISARVSARIIELPYKAGEHVTQGDPNAHSPIPPSVLVRLDSTEMDAILKSAESHRSAQEAQIKVEQTRLTGQAASIKGIRARLEEAQRDLGRLSELARSKVTSQSELDAAQCKVDELLAEMQNAESSVEAARMNIEVLRHNLASAEAEVTKCKDNLSYTTITSPIDGVVTKVNAAVGELAMTGTMNNPGTVILEVADLSQMLLVAQVDESDVGFVRGGQKAVVRIQAYPNKVFRGVVEHVALTHVLNQTRSKVFETKIVLDTEGQPVYSGLTADVDIETQCHRSVLKIPSQAVLARKAEELPLEVRTDNPNVNLSKTDTPVVYRYLSGKAVVTPVKIGPSDATHTVILSGVSEGDRIIVGPYKVLEKLSHDQTVRDERESQAKQPGGSTSASAPTSGPTSGAAATQTSRTATTQTNP